MPASTMTQTIVEKLISDHCGRAVHAGEIVLANIDLAMATDGSGPLSIELFHKMKKKEMKDPERIVMALDNYVPCPNDKVSRLHDMMRQFCQDMKCKLFETGDGIG